MQLAHNADHLIDNENLKSQSLAKISHVNSLEYQDEEILRKLEKIEVSEDEQESSELSPQSSDPETALEPVGSNQPTYMNTQALGMMYWGLGKIAQQPRQKFHKYTEAFIDKSIDQMMSQSHRELMGQDPIEVFDQIIQLCGVMAYS